MRNFATIEFPFLYRKLQRLLRRVMDAVAGVVYDCAFHICIIPAIAVKEAAISQTSRRWLRRLLEAGVSAK